MEPEWCPADAARANGMMCDYHFFRNICAAACAVVNRSTTLETLERHGDERTHARSRMLGAKLASLLGGRLGEPGLGN